MKQFLLILLISWIFHLMSAAQVGGNNTCEGALPFCTGSSYSFPAGVNAGTGQVGPFYSCLSTRPNPAWYYMKIGSKPTNITINNSPNFLWIKLATATTYVLTHVSNESCNGSTSGNANIIVNSKPTPGFTFDNDFR